MARTYRLRNLPSLPGTAKRFVDARVRAYEREEDEKIWNKIAHEVYDHPCTVGRRDPNEYYGGYRNSHAGCIPWRVAHRERYYGLYKTLRAQVVYAVEPLYRHPYVGYGLAAVTSKSKKAHRKEGNRAMRSKVRRMLRDPKSWDDDFEDKLPARKDMINEWDLT